MRISSPLLIRIFGFIFAKTMWLLFRTLRLEVRTTRDANPYAASGTARFLYSVWHDSVVMAAFGGKHVRTVALTSYHRDGSFVASVLRAIGVPSVRGSTGHHGGKALREILTVAQDRDIVMTPDGPRGPCRQMSKGIVFLASRSGRAIVPTAFACEKAWTIKGSWSDLVIPKPFSRVFLLAGDPVVIPGDLARNQFAQYTGQMQQQMDCLDAEARRLARIFHEDRREEERRSVLETDRKP